MIKSVLESCIYFLHPSALLPWNWLASCHLFGFTSYTCFFLLAHSHFIDTICILYLQIFYYCVICFAPYLQYTVDILLFLFRAEAKQNRTNRYRCATTYLGILRVG